MKTLFIDNHPTLWYNFMYNIPMRNYTMNFVNDVNHMITQELSTYNATIDTHTNSITFKEEKFYTLFILKYS